MVIPGQITFTNKYYAVKLQSTQGGSAIAGQLSSYVGSIITGSLSGITARVISFTDATSTDDPTLYVKYLTTASSSHGGSATTGVSVANSTVEFINGENYESLGIDNNSTFTIAALKRNDTNVNINSTKNGQPYTFKAKVRIDTDKEWDYFLNDGILNYVLKNISNST